MSVLFPYIGCSKKIYIFFFCSHNKPHKDLSYIWEQADSQPCFTSGIIWRKISLSYSGEKKKKKQEVKWGRIEKFCFLPRTKHSFSLATLISKDSSLWKKEVSFSLIVGKYKDGNFWTWRKKKTFWTKSFFYMVCVSSAFCMLLLET